VNSLLLVLSVIRDAELRSMLKNALEARGHSVVESEEPSQARSLLDHGIHPDLLVFGPDLPGSETRISADLEFLRCAAAAGTRVCLLGSPAETEIYARAGRIGMVSMVEAPLTRGRVESIAAELCREAGSGAESPRPGWEALQRSGHDDMRPLIEELGENRYFLALSPAMREIHRQCLLLADLDVPVLILGESGTGKEVVANLIHSRSRRSRQKLLNVNCAALPVDLLESELFGHRQGAFTGAVRDRAGRFEQADRGTLLLDEIGEISAQMQAKLLHVLQDGQFTRLGGQQSTRVDVRILAATNIEMETALRERTFREDLYYRLSAFTIHVPALRQRREEIPWLIEETIRRAPAEIKAGSEIRFSSRLIDAACLCEWRGNIRELRNFVIRTLVLRDLDAALRELDAKSAPLAAAAAVAPESSDSACASGMRAAVRDLKDRTEARMIREALDASGWNRRHAAQHLNISYRALLYKIQRHRLAPSMARGME
jgi:two-component system, NtrC family, response regulator AtoC